MRIFDFEITYLSRFLEKAPNIIQDYSKLKNTNENYRTCYTRKTTELFLELFLEEDYPDIFSTIVAPKFMVPGKSITILKKRNSLAKPPSMFIIDKLKYTEVSSDFTLRENCYSLNVHTGVKLMFKSMRGYKWMTRFMQAANVDYINCSLRRYNEKPRLLDEKRNSQLDSTSRSKVQLPNYTSSTPKQATISGDQGFFSSSTSRNNISDRPFFSSFKDCTNVPSVDIRSSVLAEVELAVTEPLACSSSVQDDSESASRSKRIDLSSDGSYEQNSQHFSGKNVSNTDVQKETFLPSGLPPSLSAAEANERDSSLGVQIASSLTVTGANSSSALLRETELPLNPNDSTSKEIQTTEMSYSLHDASAPLVAVSADIQSPIVVVEETSQINQLNPATKELELAEVEDIPKTSSVIEIKELSQLEVAGEASSSTSCDPATFSSGLKPQGSLDKSATEQSKRRLKRSFAVISNLLHEIDVDQICVLGDKIINSKSVDDQLNALLEHSDIIHNLRHYKAPTDEEIERCCKRARWE